MRSAIIATVLNEAAHIRELLHSLERQTRIPDVIVITDGGSTDGTQDILQAFASSTKLPFHWHTVPGGRSVGRNAAIRTADADVIAVTDIDILEPTWFGRIIQPLETGTADVVGGWYEAIAESPRERALGAMTLFSLAEVRRDSFVPASRSIAFTRDAWRHVGGYDERLATAEDTFLAFAMRQAGMRFAFEPSAVVRCWTATTVGEAFRMYRRYARSDGQGGALGMLQTRYGRLYAVYGLGAGLLVLGFWWPFAWLILLAGGLAYAFLRVRKVLRLRLWSQVPYSMLVGLAMDLAQMSGYASGKSRGLPEIATDRKTQAIRPRRGA